MDFFLTTSISNTLSSALKIFKSLCPGSTLSPSADKLCRGERKFSFSSLCTVSPQSMKSLLLLFAVRPGNGSAVPSSPHSTPEHSYCCSYSQADAVLWHSGLCCMLSFNCSWSKVQLLEIKQNRGNDGILVEIWALNSQAEPRLGCPYNFLLWWAHYLLDDNDAFLEAPFIFCSQLFPLVSMLWGGAAVLAELANAVCCSALPMAESNRETAENASCSPPALFVWVNICCSYLRMSCSCKMSNLDSHSCPQCSESCALHPGEVWYPVKETSDVFGYAETAPWAQHRSGEGKDTTASFAVRFPPPWRISCFHTTKAKAHLQRKTLKTKVMFCGCLLHP